MARRLSLCVFLAAIAILSGCSPTPTLLESIQQEGELRVITLNGPVTFYEGAEGPAGFEYELIKRFSEFIGVKPRFIIPDNFDELIPAVASGEVHLAAAGLTITPERRKLVRFTDSYQSITTQVVYLSGTKRPRKVEDLISKKIELVAGSSHEETLQRHQKKFPGIKWQSTGITSMELMMQNILDQKIDFALGDSNEIAVNRRYYPEIKIGFNLTPPEQLAWALPHSHDESLFKKTTQFFKKIKASGVLDQLLERYYGHVDRLNFVDKRTFWRHVDNRLPLYRDLFKQAAKKSGYDWRLLAAIGYQESHWNPKAKSPTGVRGIMMLTKATAKQLGIKNRLSPQQSILGGARYLQLVEKKIPERIAMPDRLWLALAGYNIGFGHLEDARILTQRNGGNPDKWSHVKKHLPSLSDPKVYKTLKHGYARGQEPVNYVDNIRNFYDLLIWKDNQKPDTEQPLFRQIPASL